MSDETREYEILKLREQAFVQTLSVRHQAIYSLGGRPMGSPTWGPENWPSWPECTLEILARVGDTAGSHRYEASERAFIRSIANRAEEFMAPGKSKKRNKMKTVTKRDLIDRICERHPGIRKTDVTDIISTFLDTIGTSLTEDKRIELRDFGVFTPKERKARTARNPKTGAPVQVKATKVCGFKVGKELKERLAASYKPSDD